MREHDIMMLGYCTQTELGNFKRRRLEEPVRQQRRTTEGFGARDGTNDVEIERLVAGRGGEVPQRQPVLSGWGPVLTRERGLREAIGKRQPQRPRGIVLRGSYGDAAVGEGCVGREDSPVLLGSAKGKGKENVKM